MFIESRLFCGYGKINNALNYNIAVENDIVSGIFFCVHIAEFKLTFWFQPHVLLLIYLFNFILIFDEFITEV